ncbi:MAG: Gfo/Idh/MocA family protein [Gemmatimonadota bacterium]
MPLLRVGVLGCGDIAQRVHLPVLSRLGSATVAAIADHDSDALERCSRFAPAAALFSSTDDLLQRSGVDAVVIALPTTAHYEVAMRAMESALHVYLEKPMALNLGQATAMHEKWLETGKVGTMGFNHRFNPLLIDLRRRLARNDIGRLVAARASWTAPAPSKVDWRTAADKGGGALFELSSHQLDSCRFLFNTEIDDVRTGSSLHGEVMLEVKMASGLRVQLLSAFGSIAEDRWDVYGEKGKLSLDRFGSLFVDTAGAETRGGLPAALRRIVGEVGHIRYGIDKARSPAGDPSYGAALASFIESAASGTQRPPSFADGLAVQHVLELARGGGAA